MRAERHELIDALRGIALFGILAVNIQGFVWFASGGPSLGVLWEDAPLTDTITVFVTALLLEFKFYPIFCFCFGYGFAIMARSWRRQGLDHAALKQRFTRRINFMLALGFFHGLLIWFGDILARYALTAYILRRHLGKGPRALIKALRFWFWFSVVLGIVLSLATLVAQGDIVEDTTQKMMASFNTFAYGGYLEQTPERVKTFFMVLSLWIFAIPQAMALFLAGAVVAQLGWLHHPERHRDKWWRVLWISLALGTLPTIAQAFASVALGNDPMRPPSFFETIGYGFAPLLAPAYVAALALCAQSTAGKALVRLVSPAGRMALTFYLGESILCSVALLGYGLQLAPKGQTVLFLVAVTIYAVLLAFSHWYLARFQQGPMESIWRRYTYAPPPVREATTSP